jgi:hypothetical protein
MLVRYSSRRSAALMQCAASKKLIDENQDTEERKKAQLAPIKGHASEMNRLQHV